MISNFLLPKMQELYLQDMYFQQDVATCHVASLTMKLLRGEFGEHFISCPDRSIDLTPLVFFLGGYVKAHVYTDKPDSINGLEDNSETFIRGIPTEMLERVYLN